MLLTLANNTIPGTYLGDVVEQQSIIDPLPTPDPQPDPTPTPTPIPDINNGTTPTKNRMST